MLAEQSQLDVSQITKEVVKLIKEKNSFTNKIEEHNTDITPNDIQLMKAIEWLCFDPQQRIDALEQCNSIARYFITSKRPQSAIKLFQETLPTDTLSTILDQQNQDLKLTQNIIREHLCLKTYLESYQHYQQWQSHYYTNQPQELRTTVVNQTNYNELLHHNKKLEQHVDKYFMWNENNKIFSQKAIASMMKVLTYPNGWLVMESNAISQEYILQLDSLRRICIPETFFLLHSMLFQLNLYKERYFYLFVFHIYNNFIVYNWQLYWQMNIIACIHYFLHKN